MNDQSARYIILNDAPLLKGSGNTNIIFKIEGVDFNRNDLSFIHSKLTIKDKLEIIYAIGGKVKFETVEGEIFKSNLLMVDGYMPKILSELIILSVNSDESLLYLLAKQLDLRDPLKYGNSLSMTYYTYKVKELLIHLALGMDSSKIWTGKDSIFDHYPVIKIGNDILYYIQNIKRFCEVILINSFLELSQVVIYSSQRYLYLKINLEIKFALQ